MKKNYFLLIGLLLVSANIFSSPLSGTYTINSSSSTGGSNFKTWIDFQQSITSNGVSGSVNVDVLTDEVSSSQIIFGSVSGTSRSNRIVINGHGKKLSANLADAVILLNGVDYLQLDSVIIINTSSNSLAIGIRFKNASDFNTISHCLIEFSNMANATLNSGAYIAFADAANSLIATVNTSCGTYNTIQYNIMRCTLFNSTGPTFGILLKGNASTYSGTAQNNTVRGNIILNFASMGIYMYQTNGNQLVLNDISRIDASSDNCSSTIYGIYSVNAGTSNRSNRIDSNHIHDLPKDSVSQSGNIKTVYAIYTYYVAGKDSLRFSISSNVIQNLFSSQNCYVMSNSYNNYMDVQYNLIDNLDLPIMGNSSAVFYGIYNSYIFGSYRLNNNTIKNCDGGYTWYGIQNFYPRLSDGVQQINGNSIINNLNAYQYRYGIYSYYADKSDKLHQIEIKGNHISKNSTDKYYFYNIYCQYYGDYKITDNTIDQNISTGGYMYGLYFQYYGTYQVERNIIRGNTALGVGIGTVHGISSSDNYGQHLLSNLIVENSGYNATYGIFLSSNQSANYSTEVRQNTISDNGSLSGYAFHSSYPIYCTMPYSKSLDFIGNVLEVVNSNSLFIYLLTGNTLNVDYNSYHVSNINTEYYSTTSNGSDTSLIGWINLSLGSNELNAVNGHFFDSVTYATKWYNNQNNVPSVSYNLLDVYSVARSSSYSDRGAVEYSGVTAVKDIKHEDMQSTIYPNPNRGDVLFINNTGQQQVAILYDITGKILNSFPIQSGINSIESHLTQGIYFVCLSESGQLLKLVVE